MTCGVGRPPKIHLSLISWPSKKTLFCSEVQSFTGALLVGLTFSTSKTVSSPWFSNNKRLLYALHAYGRLSFSSSSSTLRINSGRHSDGAELVSVTVSYHRPIDVRIWNTSRWSTVQNDPVASSGSDYFGTR
ncbi:hypothetical protein BpHYR1_012029 [Brachionus plicatilis]|uniref:Uncharacterized protein n=1 Tax=Brachionus plicatilis TaxID=10195 RepID=A0A3M7QBH9_BRAPC|nr:hypothetical protein BpHYR1_012029 [Brachionus plicatilis]